jgi:hypothetical protein
LFVLLAACSSEGSGAGTGMPPECPQPVGTYEATFTKKGGSCNDLGPQLMIIDKPDDGCTTTYSRGTRIGDGCKLEQRLLCQSKDASTTVTLVIDIPASLDPLRGTYSIGAETISEPHQTCSGTYDVVFVKR